MIIKENPDRARGFTLLELIIVIAIITFVGAIAIPSVSKLVDDSKTKIGEANETVLKNALEMYYTDNGKYPQDNLGGSLVPKYIDEKSWEKMTEKFNIDYSSLDGKNYTLTVSPKNN
ncbi:type II secretion system protein [Thermosediminibacter oceani]|uniref:Uncharacterized protein n=1 Tax=Thermosediminibacter oceani (strain ATCC BAA-1034 / DSM 16646 / JW/IW-1228P) TaxID=555079 RepID=D9RXL5_THEOJ|nr:prepilin-type N-terminal cleavage/methylation domain-containing protein [Thermosediminibacter oceani]ADL08089.1 conserved hypothetical protein [Thermosediminibacter oceani DSM 16646]